MTSEDELFESSMQVPFHMECMWETRQEIWTDNVNLILVNADVTKHADLESSPLGVAHHGDGGC